jgi:hypothetical protein
MLGSQGRVGTSEGRVTKEVRIFYLGWAVSDMYPNRIGIGIRFIHQLF